MISRSGVVIRTTNCSIRVYFYFYLDCLLSGAQDHAAKDVPQSERDAIYNLLEICKVILVAELNEKDAMHLMKNISSRTT